MKTAVVILNYNTREYLERFLPALCASCEGLDAQVVVADNASSDGSADFMKEKWPEIPLICLDGNYGYTGGYNRALAMLDATYYVLINSDIEVPADWLSPLVDWMDSHPECAACAPKLLDWNNRGRFEYAGAAGGYLDLWGYPYCRGRILQMIEEDHGQYDEPARVLWASGACLMVRAAVFHGLGGFDERFFAHMEEIDLCWRMQLEGFKIDIVPSSKVWHIGGGTLPNNSPFKLRLNFRNNLLLLENNLARTFRASHPMWTDDKCYFRARRHIIWRMLLDGGSALVFLLTGRKEFFKAVIQAHKEYRQLRSKASLEGQAHLAIEGLSERPVVLTALFFRK
ncbi:MAG: glycosyltransferase family 2 protein [Bacteroidales bacterium]|nr:glycosyltransferase family 2 protein [Bacteroidales bacterium]MBP5373523.1 glycosyltransferase family 2 protein [Bacteroidales bacterium]